MSGGTHVPEATNEQVSSGAQQAPVGPPVDVKSISRTGRSCPPLELFSFVAKRLAVSICVSSPMTIQPKFCDGLSSQNCTSATIPEVDPHVYVPVPPTRVEALIVPE